MDKERESQYFVYAGMAAAAAANLAYYLLNRKGASIEKSVLSEIVEALPSIFYGGLAGAVLGEAVNGFYNFSKSVSRFVLDKFVWYKDVKRFLII